MSLIKLAMNRFTKEYHKDNLSNESIHILRDKGIIRSPEQMVNGLNKGSYKIAKNKGVKIISPTILDKIYSLESHYDPMMKKIHLEKSVINNLDNIDNSLVLRHEVHEALENGKGNRASIINKRYFISPQLENHANLAVLGRDINEQRRILLSGKSVMRGYGHAMVNGNYKTKKNLQSLRKLPHDIKGIFGGHYILKNTSQGIKGIENYLKRLEMLSK